MLSEVGLQWAGACLSGNKACLLMRCPSTIGATYQSFIELISVISVCLYGFSMTLIIDCLHNLGTLFSVKHVLNKSSTLIRSLEITFTTTDIPSTINTHNTELQMVKVHINNTKHITIANLYILLETAHPGTIIQLTRTYNTAYSTSQTCHTQSSPEM